MRGALRNPETRKKMTELWSAVDVLIQHNLLSPEEYNDVKIALHTGDTVGAFRYMMLLCDDKSVPENCRRFMAVVIVAHNMYTLGDQFETFTNPEHVYIIT